MDLIRGLIEDEITIDRAEKELEPQEIYGRCRARMLAILVRMT